MIIGVVGNAQVLGLSEDVVALEGEGSLAFEEQLLDFRIQNILRLIIEVAGVSVVPVVIELTLQGNAGNGCQ